MSSATWVELLESPAKITCDRCKRNPVTHRITYPPPADWRRLLCWECWADTKDRDPLQMIREGDGTV